MPASGTMVTADDTALEQLGRRLRETRKLRGMTQADVGEALNCDATVVCKIEAGTYPITPKLTRAVERLLSFAASDGNETWFISYMEIEQQATALRTWQPLVIPGLLQTGDYARHALRAAAPGNSDADIEQRVTARLARQEIWDRDEPPPPLFSVILGEAALRREVGGREVMRGQLEHLADMAVSNRRVSVQVLPFSADGGAGLLAPFVLASFAPESRPDVAYVDNALDGAVIERRDQVARLSLLCDSQAREALSPRESLSLIREVIAGWN